MRKYWKLEYWHYTPTGSYQYFLYSQSFRKIKAEVRKQKALGWTGEDGEQIISRCNNHTW